MGKTFKNKMKDKDFYKCNHAVHKHDKQGRFTVWASKKKYRRMLRGKYLDMIRAGNSFFKKISNWDYW